MTRSLFWTHIANVTQKSKLRTQKNHNVSTRRFIKKVSANLLELVTVHCTLCCRRHRGVLNRAVKYAFTGDSGVFNNPGVTVRTDKMLSYIMLVYTDCNSVGSNLATSLHTLWRLLCLWTTTLWWSFVSGAKIEFSGAAQIKHHTKICPGLTTVDIW